MLFCGLCMCRSFMYVVIIYYINDEVGIEFIFSMVLFFSDIDVFLFVLYGIYICVYIVFNWIWVRKDLCLIKKYFVGLLN